MKKIILLFILVFTLTNCKKEKLTGDNSKYVGTWKWIHGWADSANENFKLEITEKGKYKLFNGDDKIDYGRLLDKSGQITIISDKPGNKGYFTSDYWQIIYYKSDTLGLGNSSARDFPSSGYVRQ